MHIYYSSYSGFCPALPGQVVANKAALLEQMNLFLNKFMELKDLLEAEDVDGMRAMMRRSTQRRALFDKK